MMRRPNRICLMFLMIAAAMLPLPQYASPAETDLFPYAATLSAFSSPLPFSGIVEIALEGKTYVPHEVRAKPGDTIRICNKDPFFHQPFSYTKYNQFGTPKGVRIKPGECILSFVVQNPTKIDLCVKLNDELHSMERGLVAVSPEGGAFSWSGSWNIVQTTPDGTKYTGTMKLEQSGNTLTGLVDWNLQMQGKLTGTILECNKIDFTLQYGRDLAGEYSGVLLENGIEITNGTAKSSKGGPPVIWSAGRGQ